MMRCGIIKIEFDMRHRPKRENYPMGTYGDMDYQERLERYCTYLENRNKALTEQCNIAVVMPSFLKPKYTLQELDQYVMELSARTDKHIHRGKLDDIEKLIRWRRRYDALNGT